MNKAAVFEKLSTYVLYVLMAVSAVVLLLFYFHGYDNTVMVAAGPALDPAHTDLLMYWMYALLVICILCAVLFALVQFFATLKTNPKSAIKGVASVVLFAALIGGAYAISDDAPVMNNGKAFEDSAILKFTDVCIYVQYVLLSVTIVCTLVSLTGVFKVINKVKA
ncbi:MAG: hypothetical protein E7090_05415 [Bacteroidales bacterium]|nr:hypothetical protein [Bacteroidales bacterium]